MIKYEIQDMDGKTIESGETDVRNVGYVTRVLKNIKCKVILINDSEVEKPLVA